MPPFTTVLPFAAPPRTEPARAATPRVAIAIPARDEVTRLPGCLAALGAQRGPGVDSTRLAVVVLANNCRDATAVVARAMAPTLPFRLVVEEAVLPPSRAHAGGARRAAMDAAAALLGGAGDAVLLSTDADGRAGPGWLAANLAAVADGADAVAGAIDPDPAEAALWPASLRRREALEGHYAALLDEMAARIDPDPHDPWPRHAAHSGASIAVTLAAYRRIGGLPEVPVGEDRALFDALLRAGMRVRHAPDARVTVSCRLDGRAAGGMADTLRRRLAEADAAPVDARLEPAMDTLLRLRCRRALRLLRAGTPRRGDPWRLALALGLAPAALLGMARPPRFVEAWEAMQRATPLLRRRRPVPAGAIPAEAARAATILAVLRRLQPAVSDAAARPADTRRSVSAA